MSTRPVFNKFLFIFFLLLVFMISSCSTPSEDKEQISETTQTEPAKVETPATETPKPTAPPAPEPAKPEVLEPVASEPAVSKPAEPEPVAESTLADIITMQNPAYLEHKKGIVLFTHKKHSEEYQITCGQCHHDKEGKPLENLKENDKVDACLSCHTKLGQAPRPKDKKKLTKTEKLEYHAEAIHENCIACHKEFNKENNTKAAPTSCSKCHPKRK